MTIKELHSINQGIKTETLRFCQGMVPSLDMIGSLAVVLAEKTHSSYTTGDKWVDVVYNTIEGIIRKEIA